MAREGERLVSQSEGRQFDPPIGILKVSLGQTLDPKLPLTAVLAMSAWDGWMIDKHCVNELNETAVVVKLPLN